MCCRTNVPAHVICPSHSPLGPQVYWRGNPYEPTVHDAVHTEPIVTNSHAEEAYAGREGMEAGQFASAEWGKLDRNQACTGCWNACQTSLCE